MPDTISPAGTISPADYNRGVAKWLTLLNASEGAGLAQSFTANGQRLQGLRFPIERIVHLLSAVGVRYLKARFLILNENDNPRFAVAVYATDAGDEQLSAYYLAQGEATGDAAAPERAGTIPTPLAATWLRQWRDADQVNAAQFTAVGRHLEGYNFAVEDFLAPLREKDSFDDLEVRLSFGLSAYYPAAPEESLRQTFGLLLHVYDAGEQNTGGYYDMSTPCPPGH